MIWPRENIIGAIVAIGVCAINPPAAIPSIVDQSSVLNQLVLRLAAGLPSVLFAVAIGGGVAAAVRSWGMPAGSCEARGPAAARQRRLLDILGPIAAVAAFMVPLFKVWIVLPSYDYTVFGLFPVSDADGYYRGAENLLETGTLDDWNCRRPLNAAFLAVRLAAAGHNIQWVQAIQAALLGLAVYALARSIAKDLGWPSGLLVFTALFGYGGRYVHWLTSEWLGLCLGATAFAILWTAARSGRRASVGWGMAVLTLALNARAGTFFVLPTLVIWSGRTFRGKKAFHWAAAGLAAAGILAGTVVNGAIPTFYGKRAGLGHGNFSLTLYGLASGIPGWAQIYRDFPESERMPESELNAFAWRKAQDRIAKDPSDLLKGLASASGEFLTWASRPYTRLAGQGTRNFIKKWVIDLSLAAGAMIFLARFRRRREPSMVLASLAGFLLSIPILWVDGGERVFAATAPLPAVLFSCGICGWRRIADFSRGENMSRERLRPSPALVLASVAFVVVVLAGPAAACRQDKALAPFPPPGSADRVSVVIRSDAPRVTVLAPGAAGSTFVPRIGRAEYILNLPPFARDDLRRLPKPGIVFYARDRLVPATGNPGDKYVWVIGPAEMATEEPQYLVLRGTYRRETNVFHVSGFSVVANPADWYKIP